MFLCYPIVSQHPLQLSLGNIIILTEKYQWKILLCALTVPQCKELLCFYGLDCILLTLWKLF